MARRTGVTARVLAALLSSDRPLHAVEIADRVYADDPDGGPDAATETVWSTIRDLKLKGHRITANPRHGGYTYHGSPVA